MEFSIFKERFAIFVAELNAVQQPLLTEVNLNHHQVVEGQRLLLRTLLRVVVCPVSRV